MTLFALLSLLAFDATHIDRACLTDTVDCIEIVRLYRQADVIDLHWDNGAPQPTRLTGIVTMFWLDGRDEGPNARLADYRYIDAAPEWHAPSRRWRLVWWDDETDKPTLRQVFARTVLRREAWESDNPITNGDGVTRQRPLLELRRK